MADIVQQCRDCGFEFEMHMNCCPHCARPSLFPNVTTAHALAEKVGLKDRYQAARNEAQTRSAGVLVQQFEEVVAQHSHAVIARSFGEMIRLASSDSEVYSTFYNLVQAGIHIPKSEKWDKYRGIVDEMFFPYYKEHIRFAALSLDDNGLINYGEFSLVLRNDMISHRATVFEENSMLFVKKRNIHPMEDLPAGYRACWEDRGKLAVAKLSRNIDSNVMSNNFAEVLLKNGANSGEDEFIEVHIYGSITIRTLKKIAIRVSATQRQMPEFDALKENLKKHNVEFLEH